MNSNPANNPSSPSDQELTMILVKTKPLWDDLIRHLETDYAPITRRWILSKQTSAWWLRLIRKQRTVVYLSPQPEHFMAAFVFGEKATAVIQASDLPDAVKTALNEARVYAEGRGIRLKTRTKKDVAVMKKLAAIKMAH